MPPFRSESQRRFLYSQHPEIAKIFAEHTPKGAKLPEHVKGGKKDHKSYTTSKNASYGGYENGYEGR